jgi:hypothetical protein
MSSGRYGFVLLALIPLFFVSGCGQQSGTISEEQRRKEDLAGIYDLYKLYAKKNQKPPAQLADLTQKEQRTSAPGATRVLQSEEYLVVWGADLAVNDGAVLAYEKAAPTAGGWVLLRDGTVKQMTAAEFEAAPKAK